MIIKADIAIVGAGVAGCIAAIALAPHYQVVLIDKLATAPERIGECLPPAARRIFSRLGLQAEFDRQSHLPSQGMRSCWGGDQPQIIDNLANPEGLGWHLDRVKFENLLRTIAIQRGATALWPTKLIASQFVDQHWQLQTDTEQQIQTRWVIDASGRAAAFVRQQAQPRTAIDKLISCWTIVADSSQSRMGQISASPDGWWYSAPIPEQKRVIAWQTDSDLIELKKVNCLADLMALAQQQPAIAALLAQADPQQSINIVPANTTRLQQVMGPQWIALGDAALSFDPLSSQGMYNGMASAMQVADLFINKQPIQAHYPQQMERIWQHYLSHRQHFYRLEQRWPNQPFWQRRSE